MVTDDRCDCNKTWKDHIKTYTTNISSHYEIEQDLDFGDQTQSKQSYMKQYILYRFRDTTICSKIANFLYPTCTLRSSFTFKQEALETRYIETWELKTALPRLVWSSQGFRCELPYHVWSKLESVPAVVLWNLRIRSLGVSSCLTSRQHRLTSIRIFCPPILLDR